MKRDWVISLLKKTTEIKIMTPVVQASVIFPSSFQALMDLVEYKPAIIKTINQMIMKVKDNCIYDERGMFCNIGLT